MIDTGYLLACLEDLVLTPSPVGRTEPAMTLVKSRIDELGLDYSFTRRGILSVQLGQGAPKRALAAHIDTLGAMVTGIGQNGCPRIANLGTWAARFAEGARVTVFTDATEIRGTILPLKASGHRFNTEVDTQPAEWTNLEIRLDCDAETAKAVQIGDMVAIDAQPEFLENGFIVSRHLDDKAGVACLLAALNYFAREGKTPKIPAQILFTISEEVGIGGTHGFGPDVQELVAIDNAVTAPDQASRDDSVTIAFKDRTGPFDLPIARHLVDLCAANSIPHVRDTFRSYRSDSAAAIEAGWDLRVGLAAFSLDSSHGWERTHVESLVALTRLIIAYLESDLVALPA